VIDTLLGRPGSRGASVFDAIARSLVAAGIGPNSLTCTALALGLVAAALFFVDHGWWAMLVLVGSGLLDAVDGRVARLGRGATAWGGVLDLTSDRVVEAAVLLGVVVPHPAWHLPALVLACTWYVNLCVFLAVGAATDRQPQKLIAYPPGLLERGELLVVTLLVVAVPGIGPAAMYVYAVLELITGAQRFRHGRRVLAT